jgi:hypothetical protein
LHTTQLFTVEYPEGDRSGSDICVRVTQAGQPMDLHRFLGWGDYFKLDLDAATKSSDGAPKPPGVAA